MYVNFENLNIRHSVSEASDVIEKSYGIKNK